MIKEVKICLYPNKHQQSQLLQMFGNDRFLWNQMLAMAKARYKNNPSSRFVNWYGKKLVIVSPSYTSQICSSCGYHSGKKPLEIREWTCHKCGTHHDRDVNAAINILNKGLEKLKARD